MPWNVDQQEENGCATCLIALWRLHCSLCKHEEDLQTWLKTERTNSLPREQGTGGKDENWYRGKGRSRLRPICAHHDGEGGRPKTLRRKIGTCLSNRTHESRLNF